MKKFFLALVFTMLLCLFPCFVYAEPLDAATGTEVSVDTEKVEQLSIPFSVTGGIDFSKDEQSTFDSTRTISGNAAKGTKIDIRVRTTDASGTTYLDSNYCLKVGASGLFSQTIDLGVGENIIEMTITTPHSGAMYQSAVLKRKRIQIKKELENTISIPGSARQSLFLAQ